MNNGTMVNSSSTSNMGKFFTSNYLITILLILVIVIILIYLFVRLGYSVKNYQNDSPYIIEDTIQGTNAMHFYGSKLLRSYDQPFGLEFSY